MVFIDILTFFIALAVLIKGSDIMVTSASSFAKSLGISEFIIGLTVVSIGTSIPELATGVSASIIGDGDLILGTILGSNIANIGLILGIAAIISVLRIDKVALYRDGIFLISTSALFILMAFDRIITRLEGIMLLILFLGYIYHLIRSKKKDKFGYEQYVDYFWNLITPSTYTRLIDRTLNRSNYRYVFDKYRDHKSNFVIYFKQILTLLFALGVIILSSSYLIPSASNIASAAGISEAIVGFLMIAIGTSLPELIVSLTSIYRKLNNILIGNIIGSNIANLMLVGGVSAIISPIKVSNIVLFYMIPFMFFLTLLFLHFIKTNWFLQKLQGIIFLVLYFSFAILIFLL